MTKTKCFTKVTAVLMAVIMMFATLGITAFASGTLTFSSSGSAGHFTVKITYSDCNYAGKTTGSSYFTLDNDKTLNLKFTTSVPSSTIRFYRNDEDEAYAEYTTPAYVSGMSSTLTTSIKLKAGNYKVGISSAEYATVSGYFEISTVDGVHK